jgi:hypothetical protein
MDVRMWRPFAQGQSPIGPNAIATGWYRTDSRRQLMETLEAYLDRKEQELSLLNSFLDSPLTIRRPVSAVEVIQHKFQLASALKAEQALHDMSLTI